MTMRFMSKTSIVASDSALRTVFAWLDFMRTASPNGAGWNIVQSSNGVEVNVDQDNIAAFGDLTHYSAGVSQSWFVIETPDGAGQFLWARYDADDRNWRVYYSPTASYSGGDAGNAPGAPGEENFGWCRINTSEHLMRIGADDAAPYGFWMYGHASGNFATCRCGWAWLPLEVSSMSAGDTDPYIWFIINTNTGGAYTYPYLYSETANYTQTHCASVVPGQAANLVMPALVYYNNAGVFVPNTLEIDANGNDQAFPVAFGRSTDKPSSAWKGITTFMLWNGRTRAAGETFANKTRISWGDVNFPWDGTTPEVS